MERRLSTHLAFLPIGSLGQIVSQEEAVIGADCLPEITGHYREMAPPAVIIPRRLLGIATLAARDFGFGKPAWSTQDAPRCGFLD
jgi:hypothetical protein